MPKHVVLELERINNFKNPLIYRAFVVITRAGLWVGRAGHLPRALTSRGRRKGSHRPVKR
jgi:hypothetical protein